ncbi:MAG TPA: DinB family protein [Thermoanaerobaculia bacterium]|nr:DinB family protein [Thermoanaerobaculia bacterium]
MSLFPEQQRALAYARKRGTDAPLADIRSRVAGTFAEFEALVESIPPEAARERRATSAWSVQEVIDHLVESDRRAAGQLAHLLAGRDDDEPIPASLQSEKPLDLDWTELLGQFRSVHADILALLAGATDDLPLTAKAAVQMVVKHAGPDGTLTPVSWVERFDWKAFAILLHAHNREHIAQVRRIGSEN